MAVNLSVSEVEVRETRLGSITGYSGSLENLYQQTRKGELKNRDRCYSQGSSCPNAQAEMYLSNIKDTVIVSHGPLGCAATAITNNPQHKWNQRTHGLKFTDLNNASTNMKEEDTIFGALEKLRATAREMFRRHKPKAMFLTMTCVSGIIGEDISGLSDALSGEFEIPVVPVFCEGFKSKIWATGFDAAYHAVVKYIVKPPKTRNNKINFINFNESARKEVTELFARFGYEPLFLLNGRTVEELEHASESAATVSVCGTLGSYGGQALREAYGVPFINTTYPNGVEGYERWLRQFGEVLGKTIEVEAYIEAERKWFIPELEKLKKKLKGTKAVIGMGPGFAYDYIRVLKELGIEIIHASSWHYDPKYDDERDSEPVNISKTINRNIEISVSDLQNYEIANILNRLKPDIFVTRHAGWGWIFKLGITVLQVTDEYMSFGYKGTINFAKRVIDAVTNRALADLMSKHMKLPYTDWWFEQDSNKFLLDEEKHNVYTD
jgi:nitrogenase molybdenum-iron protein alpha chain